MSGKRKKRIKELLEYRDLQTLTELAKRARGVLRTLFSLTYDHDELIRWRAIEAIGQVTRTLGESELEPIRDFIRRLLWLMNDESGGLGWHAPEVIGEIIVNNPQLAEPFGALLLHYMKEEPFERGSHIALARISPILPELAKRGKTLLLNSLEDPDPSIRGQAMVALSYLDSSALIPFMGALSKDSGTLSWYDFETGELTHPTVGEIARWVLEITGSKLSITATK